VTFELLATANTADICLLNLVRV